MKSKLRNMSFQDELENRGFVVSETSSLSTRNSVFLACEKNNVSQKVVVKVIQSYLEKEIEVMKQLNHENIVRYIDSFFCNSCSNYILLMEYVTEGSLKDRMFNFGGGLRERDVLDIMFHVAKGLIHMHSLDFVHNDIKPENIVLDTNKIAKICDFEYTHKESEEQCLIKGTPMYYAPETVLNLNYPKGTRFFVKKSVDVWAFGVTFYYSIQHMYPFLPYGNKAEVLYANILEERYCPLIDKKLSQKGITLLENCFIKDREKRATMEDILKIITA